MTAQRVQRTYITLVLLQTLASSLIWGINTLFLLDAGLSLTEAFVANGAYTAGMVIFEVPTGVIADTIGRRVSYLLGAVTLLVTTLGYLALAQLGAGVGWWILVSALIGLGFTFFSGATEAWLVDALEATGFDGAVENVFGRGLAAGGAATLVGSIAGGLLATLSFAIPYLTRSALLLAVVVVAWFAMRDIGFTPRRAESVTREMGLVWRSSLQHGWGNPPVRMFAMAAPFSFAAGIWLFYAFQPYVLQLYGNPDATWLAGLAAAIVAVCQMVGGASVSLMRRIFRTRTGVIVLEVVVGAVAVTGIAAAELFEIPVGFWVAIALLTITELLVAVAGPMQQAYMNDVIPSESRASVLSFVSMMGSAGAAVAQPVLGRVSDVWSLGAGYLVSGGLWIARLPFVLAVRSMHLEADGVVVTPKGSATG